MTLEYPFYGYEVEFKPCPKCKGEAIILVSGGLINIEATVTCIQCGIRTRKFRAAKAVLTNDRIGDGNDEIRRRVYTEAAAAWNEGRLQQLIEDVELDLAGLEQVAEMIQDYLEAQADLTPGGRVMGFELLRKKLKSCGKIVRKEITYRWSQ